MPISAYKKAAKAKNTRVTSQRKKAKPEQVKNYAGGYTFALDKWDRLQRFLILGSDGGTYYASEQKLTAKNAEVVQACAAEDPDKTVQKIVEISDAGRAAKNDPALFALALVGAGEGRARQAAFAALAKVARIPTHLFHFVSFYDELVGSNTRFRRAIGDWYNQMDPQKLAYEVTKYQSRDGWSNRDLLRLAHAKPKDTAHNLAYKWVVKGEAPVITEASDPLAIIEGFEKAKTEKDPKKLVQLISDYGLVREHLPTEALNHKEVWEALLQKMPLNAMVRNLGKMTSIGLIEDGSDAAKLVRGKLRDKDYVKKSRLHPLNVLVAHKIYTQGAGMKGSLAWKPVAKVADALDDTFYLAFENVEPTGKKLLIALDVSGSMGINFANSPLTVREAAAAMAMVTMKVEDADSFEIMGFTNSGTRSSMHHGYAAGISHLDLTSKMTIGQAVRYTSGLSFGGTDCSLPAVYATEKKKDFDGILIITDNETWAGNIHPFQALKKYRDQVGKRVRQVVMGMVATEFTIADPKDSDSLDVVGFDTATPAVVQEFLAGRI